MCHIETWMSGTTSAQDHCILAYFMWGRASALCVASLRRIPLHAPNTRVGAFRPDVRAEEAVQRLATGSAGVSPARMMHDTGIDSKSFAGETPALPVNGLKIFPTVGQAWASARTSGLMAGPIKNRLSPISFRIPGPKIADL
jgi:hypothetical protein